MNLPVIVPFYAAILAFIFVVLSFRVIMGRRQFRVVIGTGGHRVLERRIRAQGNFSEYVPITVIMLTFLETLGGARWLLHVLCLALIAGRTLHAYSVCRADEDMNHRRVAMGTTFSVLLIAAVGVMVQSGPQLFG